MRSINKANGRVQSIIQVVYVQLNVNHSASRNLARLSSMRPLTRLRSFVAPVVYLLSSAESTHAGSATGLRLGLSRRANAAPTATPSKRFTAVVPFFDFSPFGNDSARN